MSISIELLDALKASQGNASDYRAAKLLCVTQPMVSKYRSEAAQMSPEKVILACNLAGLNATEWILRLQSESAKSDIEKSIWEDLLNRLAA